MEANSRSVFWIFVFGILGMALCGDAAGEGGPVMTVGKSIREFGVLPTNSAALNRTNLQKAIDWASASGAALFLEPSEEPYPVDGGLVLKMNVSLIGVHGPVGRGTRHPSKPQPVGSVFSIADEKAPFITVEGATQIKGIQFYYPKQTMDDPAAIIAYPPTIRVSQTTGAQGVTLSCLTFYGEYMAMDFRSNPKAACEQILIEHCYGYPLSGEFIAIDYCYDIPRILQCHVNPANMRYFRGGFSPKVVDAVVAKKTYTFWIDHTDNAQLMGVFTFGVYGGVYLGADTYGQMTQFNLDCVTVGVMKKGSSAQNRNWMIAQGSIIANCFPEGESIEDVHPFVIEGEGHTSISNVEAFSGKNGALTTAGKSQDFMLVRGEKKLTVSLSGCRMRGYEGEAVTIKNKKALVQADLCVDRDERAFEMRGR